MSQGRRDVVEEGDIKSSRDGSAFAVKPTFDPKIEDFLKPLFQQQYTMSFENYPWKRSASTASKSRTCHDQAHPQEQPTVPLEAEHVSPDHVAGLSNNAVRALPVFHGKRQCRLDDFFTVEGDGSDDIEILGDASRVKWIGQNMTRGSIKIHGNAGMHLGSGMRGGTIEVTGNASDWVGAEMTKGLIRIHGNAGGQIGAAYRGRPKAPTRNRFFRRYWAATVRGADLAAGIAVNADEAFCHLGADPVGGIAGHLNRAAPHP